MEINETTPPAKNPCGSCPYRKDVPSGVWSQDEYEKLPEYDKDTGYQPGAAFMCHQQNGRLCAGWCGTHDMQESFSLRMLIHLGMLRPQNIDEVLNFQTDVPLWGSGQAAHDHGMKKLLHPDADARKVIHKLDSKKGRTRE